MAQAVVVPGPEAAGADIASECATQLVAAHFDSSWNSSRKVLQ